ncbi:MAG: hypothetical protein EOP23_04940 [Hyphomicrobiales bacterium]|nr:MAG: hypothetical protein EOP23_04940 [Hyphomicrobiales bacterium]
MITRRQLLATAFGATALALAPALTSPAFARASAGSAIRVEALPSVIEAWEPHLPMVRAELARTLAEILGPSLPSGGARLVVTIGRITLSSSTRGTGLAGANEDYLESTATLYDRNGRAIASYPIRSTESASGGGLLLQPAADQFRLRALARNNAWWIKRYIGG